LHSVGLVDPSEDDGRTARSTTMVAPSAPDGGPAPDDAPREDLP
jgi:hypothetical protein